MQAMKRTTTKGDFYHNLDVAIKTTFDCLQKQKVAFFQFNKKRLLEDYIKQINTSCQTLV